MATKYSKYKVFHFQDKLDSLPRDIQDIKAPIHIRIKPTNVCNHACWYCSYQSLDDIQLAKDMVVKDMIPREKMLQIIDDCIEMGVEAITFSGGGEPFLYPHLLEVAKKLSNSNIKFASLSNGSKLKGEIAEVFAHNAEWLRISIDGWDDASYAEYRKIKDGSFTKLMDNIRNFKKIGGKCSLGISYIIDNKNYKYVYDVIKLIKETGADSIKLSPCIVDDDGKINNEYHKPIYEETKKYIEKAIKDFSSATFEINDTYHELEEKFDKEYEYCPYVQILPIIGADLNVYSCQDKAYNLDTGIVGSIKEVSFKDFWFNDKNKFFIINPSKVCNHHCIANEKNKLILDYLNIDKNHLSFV
ncbi:MAG: radical SAM protein [Sulfuricurvum sp.]|jgi:MoaA/NifB/PqqE/SkfB family radical SAM enzyme